LRLPENDRERCRLPVRIPGADATVEDSDLVAAATPTESHPLIIFPKCEITIAAENLDRMMNSCVEEPRRRNVGRYSVFTG
jgi:hypothetical protein